MAYIFFELELDIVGFSKFSLFLKKYNYYEIWKYIYFL